MTVKTKTPTLEDLLIPATALKERSGRIVPSLLSLDIALRGGIPEGINVLLSGNPKTGKTSLSLYFAACAQKQDPNKMVFFFDIEGRLRPELLKTVEGLDFDRVKILQSNDLEIQTAEKALNHLLKALKDYPSCLCILDSVAALAPEAELSSLIGDSVKMAGIASLMYKLFRHTSQILPVTNSTLIALTHLISNPRMAGKGKERYAVGGNAMAYGASVHLECTYDKKIIIEDKEIEQKRVIGQIANFKTIASALGPPGETIQVPIIYGKGVHRFTDVFTVALQMGLIKKAGSWYEIPKNINEYVRIQGKEKAIEFLEIENKITQAIEDNIRSMILE